MRVVLTDIEGTTTPVSFVKDTLFPYARARLDAWVEANPGDPDVAALVAAHGAEGARARLHGWMDEDAKVTALKAVQGRIWASGYADGSLRAPLYPDVSPALRAWRAAGVTLAVYSSGSVAAQHLLFGHTVEGDLRPLFSRWFDTTVGGKREANSYAAIASALGVPPADALFLSDVEEELDAAGAAGWRTALVARDGQRPSGRHRVVHTFGALGGAADPP